MELGTTVVEFLENKTVLVTGATGFLAKILVEKILRVQPNVKKLYLLLRATDAKSATQRMNNEIIGKELFKVLKEKLGENLNTFISEKVTLVPGDIAVDDDLGVTDCNLKEEMWKDVDIVINLAATTNFDERYDVSLGINTLGAKHVLNFAKKCSKIAVVVHVSTAYVSGERGGLILEKAFDMGETLNGTTLDIDTELKVSEDALKELHARGASANEITLAMKDLGIARARMHGWPNTYVLTKAMGEMLVGHLKDNIPLVILRPTIVTSTFQEPFPGWVEGIRTIDSLAVGYGKGRLTCFLGDPNSIIDAIPADMVVNSILASMVANASQPGEVIYHVGSSLKNPLRYRDIQDFGLRYFTSKPWINKDGTPVIVGKVKVLTNMARFHLYMQIRYLLPLKGLELANTALCQALWTQYSNLNRKIRYVMRMVELYQPYLFFKGVYDDINTEKLRIAARAKEDGTHSFHFDPKCIDWDDYFHNIHFPGLVKHVFR